MNTLIIETKCFKVFLNIESQYYIGRSVVVLKRECGELSLLEEEEWKDFGNVVKKFENALKKAFNATMFNWTCLMNGGYQNKPYSPQIHWHVRPRYDSVVKFEGLEWKDDAFGEHYVRGNDLSFSNKINLKIIHQIQKCL